MFWLAIAITSIAAIGIAVWPLLRRQSDDEARQSEPMGVYSAQMAELEEDHQQGLIDEIQTKAGKLEIQRRMLRHTEDALEITTMPDSQRTTVTVVLAIAIPALALSLYFYLGSPEHADTMVADTPPATEASSPSQPQTAEIAPLDQLTGRLAQRLETNPEDPAGWVLLGKSYTSIGQPERAIDAYRLGTQHNPVSSELYLLLGEALVVQANNQITPDAVAQFEKAGALDPIHPGPRYYLALAHFQQGKNQLAYDNWLELAQSAPADAPYLAQLRQDLIAVSGRLGIDPPGTAGIASTPKTARGRPQPTQADVDEAMAMSSDDRASFIEGMVQRLADRLADQPNDLDEWLRLGNAYKVLNRVEASLDAYGRAKDLAPQNTRVLVQYADALVWGSKANSDHLDEARIIYKEALTFAQPGSIEHRDTERKLNALP